MHPYVSPSPWTKRVHHLRPRETPCAMRLTLSPPLPPTDPWRRRLLLDQVRASPRSPVVAYRWRRSTKLRKAGPPSRIRVQAVHSTHSTCSPYLPLSMSYTQPILV